MDVLWSRIKQTDGRILVLAVITLCAVAFSIYKMAGAFSSNETTPEYRRTPPTAFAMPTPETIVDAQNVSTPRLPDDVYVKIIEKTKSISKKIANQNLTVEYLISQGMNAGNAAVSLKTINSFSGVYSGRDTNVDPQVSLGDITTNSAETSQTITYGPGAGNSPSGLFEVTYAFSLSNDTWKLDNIELDF